MLTHDEFRRRAERIAYQYRHPEMLYSLVRWLRPLVCVEVGTHIGMSAVWMARALQENDDTEEYVIRPKLHCIDNFCWTEHNQYQDWHENIGRCDVGDTVELIRGRSQEVEWPKRIDFAYIDGNHEDEVCYHDVFKAITRGAFCVCLHDTTQLDGPRAVSEELRVRLAGEWDFLEVTFDAGLFVSLKREVKPEPAKYTDQWDTKR